MSRSDAVKKLLAPGLPTGCYLIRKSQTFPADYALSIRYEDGVKHYRIQTVTSGTVVTSYFIGEGASFSSLSNIVHYYSRIAGGICCTLTHPCGTALVTSAQELSNSLGAGQEQADEGNMYCHRHAS